jgi:alpha-1,6-mannosyltransferase
MGSLRSASRSVALYASAVSMLFVALVAATPGSPFQPVLSPDAQPSGPLRWLAGVVGLDRLGAGALATIGILAVASAAIAFLLVLRAAWRGEISLRTVIGLAVAYHVVVLFLPLLFSRDVYSYAYDGKIAATYHANPYVSTPADFPRDALAPFVGPKWVGTPSVYGPLFTLASSLVARVVDSVAGFIVAFRLIAVAASLGTITIVARLVGRERPERAPFAVALIGLNPVVLFQSVASGHNDLLVMLSIGGALAFLFSGRELAATSVLALGTLVKATAAVPLLLLLVVVVARRPRGERGRALLGHLAVAGGIGLAFALPFLNTEDPSLGMVELAKHEGWLAPSRFFRRLLDAMSGDTLGVLARIAFPLVLVVAVFLIARALARRGASVTPSALGAGWGWGLLFLMLLGPVLLPWYVTWILPLAWLLPSVPRAVVIGTGTALTVSQFTAEPGRFTAAYDANLFWGHYVVTPVVIGLLVWMVIDLLRRVRRGAPLEDEPREVATAAAER